MALLDDLTDQWREAGIHDGDMVLVHSSLKRTLLRHRGLTPEDVLQSFLDAVGKEGTLLLPTFNFGFTRGEPFDVRSTKSEMGALTEAGRRHRHAVRTWHPTYSFVAIGAKASWFDGLNNFSGYGEDSPFGILHRNGGKIAILDLDDQNSMTFYHYVEELHEVSYRYHKEFGGTFVDDRGNSNERTYGLFVRCNAVVTNVNPMGELLWSNGVYTGSRPNDGCGLRVGRADEICQFTSDIIRSDPRGILYDITLTATPA